MATRAAGTELLEAGRAIRLTFEVVGRNAIVFACLALILCGAPATAYAALVANLDTGSQLQPALAISLGNWLLGVVSGAVLQAALIHGTVRDLEGRRANFGACLATGLRFLPKLTAVSVLLFVGVVTGLVLFVAPGLLMATAWAVAPAVAVVERGGILRAFGRSADLTRGDRWIIFGLMLLLFGSGWAAGRLVDYVSAAFLPEIGPGALVQSLMLNPILEAAFALLGGAGGAVVYFELRRIKEGLGSEQLAAMFD